MPTIFTTLNVVAVGDVPTPYFTRGASRKFNFNLVQEDATNITKIREVKSLVLFPIIN